MESVLFECISVSRAWAFAYHLYAGVAINEQSDHSSGHEVRENIKVNVSSLAFRAKLIFDI